MSAKSLFLLVFLKLAGAAGFEPAYDGTKSRNEAQERYITLRKVCRTAFQLSITYKVFADSKA